MEGRKKEFIYIAVIFLQKSATAAADVLWLVLLAGLIEEAIPGNGAAVDTGKMAQYVLGLILLSAWKRMGYSFGRSLTLKLQNLVRFRQNCRMVEKTARIPYRLLEDYTFCELKQSLKGKIDGNTGWSFVWFTVQKSGNLMLYCIRLLGVSLLLTGASISLGLLFFLLEICHCLVTFLGIRQEEGFVGGGKSSPEQEYMEELALGQAGAGERGLFSYVGYIGEKLDRAAVTGRKASFARSLEYRKTGLADRLLQMIIYVPAEIALASLLADGRVSLGYFIALSIGISNLIQKNEEGDALRHLQSGKLFIKQWNRFMDLPEAEGAEDWNEENGKQDRAKSGRRKWEKSRRRNKEKEGRRNGERDGRRNGERDGGRNGEIDGRRNGEIDGGRNGEIDGRQNGERDGRRNGERDGGRNGEIDGRRNGERDGRWNGEKDQKRNSERGGKKDKTGKQPEEADREKRPQQDHDGGCMTEKFETLEFRKVSFRYPRTGRYVLHDLSFKLTGGGYYAFVGENGSGKTTIVKLLSGLYDTYEGEIWLNGTELREIPFHERRRIFAILFQDAARYEDTIAQNIMPSAAQTISQEKQEISAKNPDEDSRVYGRDGGETVPDKRLLAEKLVQEWETGGSIRFPQGADTFLGSMEENGVMLSAGEWQQLLIARELAQPAQIRVMDEPMASLDIFRQGRVYEQFTKDTGSRTTLLFSHHMAAVRKAKRIFVLKEGTIAEEGSHDWLMNEKGLYAKLYETQRRTRSTGEWYACQGTQEI